MPLDIDHMTRDQLIDLVDKNLIPYKKRATKKELLKILNDREMDDLTGDDDDDEDEEEDGDDDEIGNENTVSIAIIFGCEQAISITSTKDDLDTTTEKAKEMIRFILNELMPRKKEST